MGLRIAYGTSADERHAVWVRVAERIYQEQIHQGWRHSLFRLTRAVFAANEQLSSEGGFILNWLAENYVDAALMCLRRELDVQAGTENLRNLLEDIADHPEVLTRARYVAQWSREQVYRANQVFDSFRPTRVQDSPDADYIDPVQVKADLVQLDSDAEQVRVLAERTRAHRTPERGINQSVTFRELHSAIAKTRQVVGKYYALLTLTTVGEWEPVAQFNTIAPFTKVWVTDRVAVARAAAADLDDDR